MIFFLHALLLQFSIKGFFFLNLERRVYHLWMEHLNRVIQDLGLIYELGVNFLNSIDSMDECFFSE